MTSINVSSFLNLHWVANVSAKQIELYSISCQITSHKKQPLGFPLNESIWNIAPEKDAQIS